MAAATRDLGEFLIELRKAGQFKEDFRSTPDGNVAYHAPCHLRMQNVGFRGRDLMRRIPGVKPQLVAECCGHDGTWAMKKEYFDLALKNGAEGVRRDEAGRGGGLEHRTARWPRSSSSRPAASRRCTRWRSSTGPTGPTASPRPVETVGASRDEPTPARSDETRCSR